MQLHEKIRKLRTLAGKSQTEVSESIGVSQANYSKLESGKLDITVKQVEALATLFEVAVENIIGTGDHITFNLSRNKNASGMIVKNQVSKHERKVYDDFILSLKSEIEHLKIVIGKLLEK